MDNMLPYDPLKSLFFKILEECIKNGVTQPPKSDYMKSLVVSCRETLETLEQENGRLKESYHRRLETDSESLLGRVLREEAELRYAAKDDAPTLENIPTGPNRLISRRDREERALAFVKAVLQSSPGLTAALSEAAILGRYTQPRELQSVFKTTIGKFFASSMLPRTKTALGVMPQDADKMRGLLKGTLSSKEDVITPPTETTVWMLATACDTEQVLGTDLDAALCLVHRTNDAALCFHDREEAEQFLQALREQPEYATMVIVASTIPIKVIHLEEVKDDGTSEDPKTL